MDTQRLEAEGHTDQPNEIVLRTVYFTRVRNIGDQMAPLLLEALTHRHTEQCRDPDTAHIVSIGSMFASVTSQSFVWGTGVMHPDIGIGAPDPGRILALRGKLTHSVLAQAGIRVKDVPLGDPGYLVPQLWLDPLITYCKEYRLGVVLHNVDRGHPYIEFLRSQEGVRILDVRDPPRAFFEGLVSCGSVVSTSLHGLVYAEALGLPNLWMELPDRVEGQGFTFHDWYSLARVPQAEPFRPTGSEPVDALLERCEPRCVEIDREALAGALTKEAIERCTCSPNPGRTFVPVRQARERPLPIFIISHNRGKYLEQVIASYRRQTKAIEIVIHDNGSDDPSTISVLADLERQGINVYRYGPIVSPDELNQVDATVSDFFANWAEPSRYVVTDCDIDLSSAKPEALELFDELLDRFPRAACVGPMLTISDISASYPLFNHVINRHVEQFWRREPSWVQTTLGNVAYIEAPIDTTFALHRAGEPFRRLKDGLRVYYPFEARHLDWYIERGEDSHYHRNSSAQISHWNNADQIAAFSGAPLQVESYKIVEDDNGRLRTRIVYVRDDRIPAPLPLHRKRSSRVLSGGGRSCILVLGMHRSGTSALTRVISLLGAALPKNLVPPVANVNQTGFWEPRDLWTLHNRMLAEAGSRWDDWRKLDLSALPADRLRHYESEIGRVIAGEYGGARLIVLKEPRICRFVPFYTGLLAELGYECHCVLALRNPLDVIASLARRDGVTEGFAALLWLRHVLEAEAATRALPRVIVSYDALLADWQTTVRILSTRLGVEWPRAAGDVCSEIGNFLSNEIRHFASTRHELHARGDIAAWVRDAYEALLRAERNPDDMPAYSVLDRIRDEFETASHAFGAALFPERAEREKKLELERNSLQAQLEEKEGVIQHLIPELEGRQRLIEQLVRECEERLRVSEERRELIQRLTDALKERDRR